MDKAHFASVIASSYIKRWLEQHYDTLMRSAPTRKLMEAGEPTRYGIEAALYALFAYVDQQWSANTPLQNLVREVAMDAPSEISKRLVNGFREQVIASAKQEQSEELRSVERSLLQLDDAALGSLLAWFAQRSPEERTGLRFRLSSLSDEQLQKVARLSFKELDILLELVPAEEESSMQTSPDVPSPSRLSQAIKDEIEKSYQCVDQKLAAMRKRRQS